MLSTQTTLGEAGWFSDLETFNASTSFDIRISLGDFVGNHSGQQVDAWEESFPIFKSLAQHLLNSKPHADSYSILLEYRLPYEGRRPDGVVLANNAVLVFELKGKAASNQADIDQVSAYARDLRAYHRECHERDVLPVLVLTRGTGVLDEKNGVTIVTPDRLNEVTDHVVDPTATDELTLTAFLADQAYCPLPSLVEAARELFHSGTIREIWRARASTEPAVSLVTALAREAAETSTRHLVLLTGIPGSGKTLVGMRLVHANFLDDLAAPRSGGKPNVPGLYLTGNDPLAEVLQYELRKPGGGGKTFVRHIKNYLNRYVRNQNAEPQEHVLVFDEAQRAFSPEKVADTHRDWDLSAIASEPELFVRICDRMPSWSVMVGLIGDGQEIHIGEEEGLLQWRDALESSQSDWTVHAPLHLEELFHGSPIPTIWHPELNLDTEIRFHSAKRLHEFVESLLSGDDPILVAKLAATILSPQDDQVHGIRFYITRDLGTAKEYLRSRYDNAPNARFGILASSRDKDLASFGVHNDFISTSRLKKGPWFTEPESEPLSCRHLESVVTEFGCQGLELEMSLLAWGTDLVRKSNAWDTGKAKRYSPQGRARPQNPFQMRLNAYRVLLTRGRDGTVIFVPPLNELDETYHYLAECGVPELNLS